MACNSIITSMAYFGANAMQIRRILLCVLLLFDLGVPVVSANPKPHHSMHPKVPKRKVVRAVPIVHAKKQKTHS